MPSTSRMTINQSVILKKNQSKELDFVQLMWSVVPYEATDILQKCAIVYVNNNLVPFSQPTIADILHLGWWASAAAW